MGRYGVVPAMLPELLMYPLTQEGLLPPLLSAGS